MANPHLQINNNSSTSAFENGKSSETEHQTEEPGQI